METLPLSKDLLDFYKKKTERAEREYQECLAYLEQIKVSHEDHHRQTWELHQRAKDVSDLQSALSEANTRLLAERRQLLDVLRENDELKVKELNDRRKIRYLLTQVKPPDDETTYFKERLHKRFVKTAEQEERAPDIYTVVLDGASVGRDAKRRRVGDPGGELGRRDPAAEAPGAQTVDEETLVPPGPSSGAAPAGGHGAGGPEGGSRSGIPRTQRQVRVSRMTQKSGAGSSGSPLPASVRAAQPGGGGARAGSSGSQLPAFARASHPGGGGAPPFPSHRAATSSRPASAPSPTRGSKTAPANAHRPAARSVADDDEDEYASEGSDLYDAREEIDHLKLTVKALRAQLAEQKTLLEDTVNAYAQDRQARQEEEAARKRNDAAKIEEHIEKVAKLRTFCRDNTRELVRTKHALQAAERKYREEKAKLTEEVAELSRKLTEERGRNDTVETAVEVRVSKKSENLVAELRYQLGKSEEDMREMQRCAEQAEIAYKKKIELQETKIANLGASYKTLKRRRDLEIEGFTNDILILRKQLKVLEKHILKFGPVEDRELQLLTIARETGRKAGKLSGELHDLKGKLYDTERQVRKLAF